MGTRTWTRLRSALDRPRLFYWSTCLVFFLEVGAAAAKPILDPDVWWVAAAGRVMRATHDVPRQNLFAITDAAQPWVMHEWLFALPYDLGLERWGPRFFSFVALGSLAATFGLVFAVTLGRVRKLAAGALLSLVAVVLLNHHLMSPRASNVAMFFPLAMALLAFGERFAWREVALAGGLELVWANAHGSFPLGVALLVAGACERPAGRRQKLIAAALATAVTFVNPYGIGLHRLVLRYLLGNEGVFRVIHTHVLEFRPLWEAQPFLHSTIPYGAALLGGIALLALRAPRWRLRALVVLGALAAGVVHVRNLELAALLAVVLLAPLVDELFCDVPVQAGDLQPRTGLVAIAVLVGILTNGFVAARVKPLFWFGPQAPVVRLAEQLPASARIYVPFETAGLLIWLTAERGARVLFDPRNDCYTPPIAEDGLALQDPLPEAEALAILSRDHVDTALVPDAAFLSATLHASADWQLRASDDGWNLWSQPSPVQ